MSNYRILVKTSDRYGAGTDANVYVRLIDKNEYTSKALRLDRFFKDDHERNQLGEYNETTEKLDEITEIEVWRDAAGIFDAWHLEYISVEDLETKTKVVFPYYRWIEASKHYFIEAYDWCLPQNAKYKEQRKEEIEQRRQIYEYDMRSPDMPVQVKNIPDDDKFSLEYKWDMTMNRMLLGMKSAWVSAIHGISGNFESIDDVFNVYYSGMPVPKNAKRWREDTYFGEQRKNGCNPKIIQLCTEIPHNFKVEESVLQPLLEGNTMQEAMSAKRLFIADLTRNDGISTRHGAVMTSPYCLLYLKDNKDLVPVAIQLFKTPGPENPVFYSSDNPELWTLVKMWYNLCDANYHQGAVHLCSTHVIMEGFCLSAYRTLSPSHPVYKLLAPHFLFLMPINLQAIDVLLQEDGYIDQTMTIGRIGLIEECVREFAKMDISKTDLMNNLKYRGVDDEDVLPNYYYRDDAKLVYGIVQDYVSKMVKLFYKTEQDILDDTELQNWGKEIVAPKLEGQGCVGVPGNGHFTTHDHVIQLCTFIITTCSIEHAAVNFAQYDSYAFPPAYPVKLNGHPPKTRDPVTEDDIVKALCTKELMMMSLVVIKFLNMRATNSLGDFEVVYLYHPEALKITEDFREELKKASEIIAKRDEQRSTPYEVLNPLHIPNATSI